MESYLLEHEAAVRVRLPRAITVKPWTDAHELRRALDAQGAPAIVDVRGLCEFFSGSRGGAAARGRFPKRLHIAGRHGAMEQAWIPAPERPVVEESLVKFLPPPVCPHTA